MSNPVFDFFKKVGHGFKVVGQHIAAGFKALFGEEAAERFAKASLDVLKSALGQIAVEVVSELEQQAISGFQKREIAFNTIGEKAKEAGLQASSSIINLLIELAVAALRNNFVHQDE